MSPLVSVVIPTHDRAELLSRAIDSVLRQDGEELESGGDLEVIVVDDASTEDIAAVVRRYGDAVSMIRNDTSRERGASRNLGAARASGEWLAFLDSDDEWEDEKLSTQLAAVGTARACVTSSWLIDESDGFLGMGETSSSAPHALALFNPYRAAPSSLLIERTLFQSLGGFPEDREVQGSEDWLFMVKLHQAGVDPVVVQRPLVRYRIHGGNSTAAPASYLPTTLAAVDWLSRHDLINPKEARTARAEKFEVAARAYALGGNFREAARCVVRASALLGVRERVALFERMFKRAVWVAARRLSRIIR